MLYAEVSAVGVNRRDSSQRNPEKLGEASSRKWILSLKEWGGLAGGEKRKGISELTTVASVLGG